MSRDASRPASLDFFVFRTPLLPIQRWVEWSDSLQAAGASDDTLEQHWVSDRATLRARLREIVSDPVVRESLYVASPSLHRGLPLWEQEPDDPRSLRLERGLVRYLGRMCGREVPFGLFAGWSRGVSGDRSSLALQGRETWRRHTRVHIERLARAADALSALSAIRAALPLRVNDSLYRAGGQARYVERQREPAEVKCHHARVELTAPLEAVLDAAQGSGASRETLGRIAAEAAEVELAEGLGYIDALLDNQLLRVDLDPVITGQDPLQSLIVRLTGLEGAEAREAREALDALAASLSTLAGSPLGVDSSLYLEAARATTRLPGALPAGEDEQAQDRLPTAALRTDLWKPAEASLGPRVRGELLRGAEALARLSGGYRLGRLDSFKRAFVERFGEREVPLQLALDEETGLQSELVPRPSPSPLLQGIPLGAPSEPAGGRWGRRDAVLARLVREAAARGEPEILLDEAALRELEPAERTPLAPAFTVIGNLAVAPGADPERGDFLVSIDVVTPAPGVQVMGRAAVLDEQLAQDLRAFAAAEEATAPGVIHAEIVHLHEGDDVGNVLLRPLLRGWEIPWMGRSGAPEDRQIPVDDLVLSVRDGRLRLRSRALGVEVRPRLASPHNYGRPSCLPVYRLLGAMQAEQGGGYAWSWGELEREPSLPRVRLGRVVLARATWNLEKSELSPLGALEGARRFAAFQALRRARGLPRYVALADGDNELPCDLDNALCVDSLTELLARRERAALVELWPAPEQSFAQGPGGTYSHQLMVPFARPAAPAAELRAVPAPAPALQRTFAPGSEWLYVRLYAGPASVDRLLVEMLRPLVEEAERAGEIDSWFYLRYGDPDWHLRLRLHGRPENLLGRVLPRLHAAFAQAEAMGLAWRMDLGTYDREIERYGGPLAIPTVERLFAADSRASLALVAATEEEGGLDLRWRAALLSMDRLLDTLGLSQGARRELLGRLREGFAKEFKIEAELRARISARFRVERPALERLLAGQAPRPVLEALAARHEEAREAAEALRALDAEGALRGGLSGVAASLLHMVCNRLLRSSAREQEAVLYDLLSRLYESAAARAPGRAAA